MWTLYGSNGSGSAAVEMGLLRCGLRYRVVRASTWEPDSDQAALHKVNPLGQIPALVAPDGAVMTESAAILIALGLQFPKAQLLPAQSAACAQNLRGLVYIAANCYAAIGVIDYPQRWCPDASESTLKKLRAGARARLHGCWDQFADQFQAHPPQQFLSGARPGALDMLAAVVSRWSGTRAHLTRTRPQLLGLLLQVQADPELQPVFARHWPAAK